MSATMQWKGRLGVPYQGSKNTMAKEIVGVLPRGKRFVDLFAGGCAMTHAAMISGKYETFLANDLHGFGLRLFCDAIAGKCNGRWREWVSREEFNAKKDTDPLISLCWSFSNNGRDYLYAAEKEATKRNADRELTYTTKGNIRVRSNLKNDELSLFTVARLHLGWASSTASRVVNELRDDFFPNYCVRMEAY